MRFWLVVLSAVVISIDCSSSSPTTPDPVPTSPPSEPAPQAAPAADYTVTFDSSWSATTHPEDFPSNPHFSGLIGATHTDEVWFWDIGDTASDGIKAMAERGSKTPLDEEIRAARAAETADRILSGDGIGRSPGTVSLDFRIRRDAPLVTLVSMVAPSPDWFVGVSALSLIENGDWIDELTIELYANDAGTDSGKTYAAPDQATVPRMPIRQIRGRPILYNGAVAPMGRLTFTRRD